MIDICMSGMCENCKYAELELESLVVHGFEDQRTEYTLKCRHEEICYLWERKLESERAKFKYR